MVLNNYEHSHFREATRRRVLAACHTLGYKKTDKSVVAPGEEKLLIAICPSYANMHYVRLIGAMQTRAKELGYTLLAFSTSRDMGEETRILNMCSRLPIMGILFLYSPENPVLFRQLSWKKPVVHIYDRDTALDVNIFELNSYKIGQIVGEHLLDLGHKEIAYISTALDTKQIARIHRLEGLQSAYRAHDLDPEKCIQVYTPITEGLPNPENLTEYEVGYLVSKRLAARRQSVSAIVGVNDMAAFGIMDALSEAGLCVPRDYSVCGCDNVPASAYHRISLTTVEHYGEQRGREAVDILVRKVEDENTRDTGEGPISVTRVEYAPKLIARSSTSRKK